MPLDFIAGLVFGLIDLIRLSLIVAIPVFLVVLVGQKLGKRIQATFEQSWIVSAFVTTFIVLFPIVFLAYLIPYALGYFASPFAGMPLPEFMQLTLVDYAMMVILTIVKNVITAFIFAVLLMPLIFFASFVEEKFKEKTKLPELANLFIAIFITAFAAWIIILFIFPWIYTGIFELLWWGL